METKYSFVGVFDIVHCLIIPVKLRLKIKSIGSLNFGIFNFPFSNLTNCGILKLFFVCFDLNLGNPVLFLKNPLYASSKFFNEFCNDC
jgi:hypothetical protein